MRELLTTIAAVLVVGCGSETVTTPLRNADAVTLSNIPPHPSCRTLEMAEVRAPEGQARVYELLRLYAADLGANYAVVDSFAVIDGGTETEVIARARLFHCRVFPASAAFSRAASGTLP
jgi:hypothetical protein